MRSARMILATAAASAALAIGAPGAYAAGDTDHDDSSWSKEDSSSYSDEHGKEDGSSSAKEEDSSSAKEEDSSSAKEEDSSSAKEEDSSYGKEHGKEEHGKEESGKEESGKEEHDSPHGGMHTGGGALASVNDSSDRGAAKDPRFDPETYKDKDAESGGEHGKDSWNGGKEEESGGWSKEHDKPSGGMHTGGGALAGPSATAAGLGVLAVAGTGIYALRRKKTVGGVA
ncbi:hypothetical protein [Streptomyces rishiriensis]|uniref:Uncharacterized protein n=1 Tax=Streptomyces rishiriensis TaxID=68264 RepID=A0ABU0NKZ2_STRRH|nr:hypothetical protein [Streptomyces rishiriensis]MDQ0579463.1 hypothetical protein [Streptomyces rishiriensis]